MLVCTSAAGRITPKIGGRITVRGDIQTNVIHSAWKRGAAKLCFLGSSCIYPKLAPQPLREEYLLTGPLEPTNEW